MRLDAKTQAFKPFARATQRQGVEIGHSGNSPIDGRSSLRSDFIGAWDWVSRREGNESDPASGCCSPCLLPAGKGLTEIGISRTLLSTMEHGKVEIGAEILLRISREFAKNVEWLLTGES
jgi:hypothetical protein